jgi:hypothetical protein
VLHTGDLFLFLFYPKKKLRHYLEIRLDIMAYLDPATNLGSKPQRLGVINCKSSTSDKLQTFRTIFGISCKFLTKNYLHKITLFVLRGNFHAREITEPFRKIRRRINDLRENALQ